MKRNLMIIRVVALIALALSGYILWTTMNQSAQLAGCGEGSGCDAVLQTKWSSWFGMPVSAGALVVYGVIFVLSFLVSSSKSPSWLLLVFFSLLASASGVWFMFLQVFLIKSYCIYCSLVHLCGIVITILVLKTIPVQVPQQQTGKKKKVEPEGIPSRKFFYAGLFGVLGVAVLAMGQMKSTTMQTPETPSVGSSSLPSSVPVKKVSLMNGSVPVAVGAFPVLGQLESDHVVGHVFDYTCPACRKLHPDLLLALQSSQRKTALVMIPMPLDAECNPGVSQTSYQHMNACAFAKLGLAIWRVKPEAYASFDHFMFQSEFPPSLEKARSVASQLVPADALDSALKDPSLMNQLRDGLNIFYSPAMQRKVLPILIAPDKAVYGIPHHSELTALF